MVITCIVAPVALAAILGFAFGGGSSGGPITLGVSGASAKLVQAAVEAAQLPEQVHVRIVPVAATLKREVLDGTYSGGVIVYRDHKTLADFLIPILSPGTTHTPGFRIGSRPTSLIGQEWAESLAAGLSSRLYAGRVQPGTATDRAAISITTDDLGSAGKGVLNYFAPSIAVIFLFIGGGLGMRSLLLERSGGTLVRMAAAPVRPNRIVIGKLLAILITGLVSIFVVWGVTALVFGADWGDPLGVVLMCVGSSLAMCGLGVFLTSLAKDEQAAFGIAMLVGLLLALLGGNLLPAGTLPPLLQKLSLITPNGWALVGFGRLSLLGDPASDVLGPFLVLCLIAAVTGGLALTRVRRMVQP
jgi:ABC-2 type transport system permease protein